MFAQRPPLPSPIFDMRRLISFLALVAAVGCRDPRAEANIAEAMIEVGAQMNMMQQDQSRLLYTVDSLRNVVAWQDTIIRRLASHTGLPVASR